MYTMYRQQQNDLNIKPKQNENNFENSMLCKNQNEITNSVQSNEGTKSTLKYYIGRNFFLIIKFRAGIYEQKSDELWRVVTVVMSRTMEKSPITFKWWHFPI